MKRNSDSEDFESEDFESEESNRKRSKNQDLEPLTAVIYIYVTDIIVNNKNKLNYFNFDEENISETIIQAPPQPF